MKRNEELFRLLTERLSGLDYIHPEEIPGIDLYMDQVTTFMEQHLEHSKRYPEDKVLTKTMINNYAKNNLLPPPVKKKYSREHLLMLIFIYYYKNLLSISDIQTLMKPVSDRYFHASAGLSLTDIYEELFSMERTQLSRFEEDIRWCFETALKTFADTKGEEQELLQRFAFISLLGFDVYMKKQVIELLIDDLANETKNANEKKPRRPGREDG
ncbi:MAG: DUF1836 domain-containing protein [Lachnospiraceae bacterium]|jgi:DNA-binding transcriptional MerR regulator|nr:DUF1836 domain-containing protein [Lachnospiraceae bacterium]